MNKKKIVTILLIFIMCMVCLVKMRVGESFDVATDELLNEDTTKILLYYYDTERAILAPEYRIISLKKIKENLEETLIEELLKGPAVSGFERVIPEETLLKEIIVDGDKIIVDFSKEFLDGAEDDETERVKKIFSVVYTLTELKEIDSVEIRVDGEMYAEEERM